jgi:hypothetical protein
MTEGLILSPNKLQQLSFAVLQRKREEAAPQPSMGRYEAKLQSGAKP